LAARTQSYTQQRRSSSRPTLAVLSGVVAVVAIPLAIELTRKLSGAVLLDSAWAIPVAAVAGVISVMFERGARGIVRSKSRVLVAARVLAVAGICLTLSSSLAVGIYELLLWKENH
jgi:hypothetical protein